MPFRAVVFDLDGTLLDTLADIGDSANEVLRQHEFPEHPYSAYRRFIGDGVLMLFERALPEAARQPDVIAACAQGFEESYGRHWKSKTTLYAGIAELLTTLQQRTLPLTVLSNKPHAFTVKCVAEFLPEWHFDVVFGQRNAVPRKPDPAGAIEICERLNLPPAECLYLGDSSVDMQTARNAGMLAVGASWGFRDADELRVHGANFVIDHPRELLAILS